MKKSRKNRKIAINIWLVRKAFTYGRVACAACAIEPTKISCVPCVAYIVVEAVSNARTINDTIGCIKTHYGN